MPTTPEQAIGAAIWLVVIIVALRRGGVAERIAALVLLANLGSVLLLPQFDSVQGVKWWPLTADLLVLAALTGLRFYFARKWLVWALGTQIVAVLAHLPRMIDPEMRNWGYATVMVAAGYGVLAALLYGVLREGRDDAGG